MSVTCKLKMLHDYKALISFKFAIKIKYKVIKYNQEKFLKIPHALCKHNIRFFGEFPYRKGKYLVIKSLYFCAE